MADTDQDQKTHDPTEKKITDARGRGDIATAPEIRHAVMMIAAIFTVASGSTAFAALVPMFVRLWGSADQFRLVPASGQGFAASILARMLVALTPLLAALIGFALVAGLAQGRPTVAWSRLAPKFSKLSPVSGFGRLFGKRALVEMAKTIAKCAMILTVATVVVWPRTVALDLLIGADPAAIFPAARAIVMALLKSVAVLVGALAIFDLVYQRRAFIARLRMSLQEIRDEHKQSEGDPKIKAKIRQIGVQRARRRMMARVPEASVVITNPTHYAVALRYDHGPMSAPIVVAKGVDALALRIREVAAAAGVPLVENRPLARALYASADIDRSIPIEHYAAVAEVIGYVMRLAKQRRA